MGLDYDWAVGGSTAQRSDSMILLTMDPVSKTAGMLSIPRDMWVSIPGFYYDRINDAYFLGEAFQLPGGGPGLAVKTVENLLGVPINYYVQLDFPAFISFINDIKGVKVTVGQEMVLGLQGKDQKVTLEPGTYTLDGATALAYARDRHDTFGGDFDRSGRQMQVIMGVRDRILQFNMLPNLIANAPAIYRDLSSGIHTNLTLPQIIQLALLASQIPKENIKQLVITGVGDNQVIMVNSPEYGSIDIPIPDKIRLLVDEIFTTGGPVSPAAVASDPKELMVAENARVSVQNGTASPGLAGRTGDYLKSQGMNVAEETNTTLTPYTIIIDYSGRPYTVAYLAKLMNVPSNHIRSQYDPNATIDVAVQLGSDWVNQNPMPTP
jgi:LCP family protein required for cell wall assembly